MIYSTLKGVITPFIRLIATFFYWFYLIVLVYVIAGIVTGKMNLMQVPQ